MNKEKEECCSCGNDLANNEDLCQYCLEDQCDFCGEFEEDCTCDDDDDDVEDYCGKEGCWCDTDEFDKENVADTFRPMNAFARARWLKAKNKGKS